MFPQFESKTLISVALATMLAVAPLSQADNFITNQEILHAGDTLQLTYQADRASDKALYLGAMVGSTLYVFDEQGAAVPYAPGAATPARLPRPAAGTHNLLTFKVPDGFTGDISAYQVLGNAGTDLLAGNYDGSTLREIKLRFVTGLNGGALYQQHCASCHDADPAANKYNILKGVDASVSSNAIRANKGGMGYLSTLTADEINAITAWIQNPATSCH